MSKLWLLLLLVAAAYAYPANPDEDEDVGYLEDPGVMDNVIDAEEELEDYMEEDPEKGTMDILKEAWGRFKKLGKKELKKIIGIMKKKFCSQQNDFEEDEELEDEPKKGGLAAKLKALQQKMKELKKKAKEMYANNKQKLKEELKKVNKWLCDRLEKLDQQEDVEEFEEDGDDEERGFGSFLKKLVKKVSSFAKKNMKKGLKFLKKNAVKITPLECEGKTCKSCVKSIVQLSACVEMTLERNGKESSLNMKITVNGDSKWEKNIKLGDVPSCYDIGKPIGKICCKGLQGKGKSSKGQANVNFCLAIVAPDHGVGCKFCASYQDKKFKVKMSPKLFAGTIAEDGDIVEIAKNGEDAQALLGPDEYELD
uniref:Venom redulysin 4 n=1 Tax=Ectomocoris sp. TaxID=3104572 RepID=A0AB38ZE79_9HEMI